MRARLAASLAVLICVACGPPDAEIGSIKPESGPYGTLVTITGKNLQGVYKQGARILLDTGSSQLVLAGENVKDWTPTRITFRYPYPLPPASILVLTDSGDTTAGSFEPSPGTGLWTPFLPGDTLRGVATTATAVCYLVDGPSGPRLHLDDGQHVKSFDLFPTGWHVSHAWLRATATGVFEGVAVVKDPVATGEELYELQWDVDVPLLVPTGIAVNGSHFGANVDFKGLYAWLQPDGGSIARVRKGASGWAVDSPTVSLPTGMQAPSLAVGGDGTVWVAFGRDATLWPDTMAVMRVARLPPGAQAFEEEQVAGRFDDYVKSTGMIGGTGEQAVVDYCWEDVDPFGITRDTFCARKVRGVGGTWADAGDLAGRSLAFGPTGLAAAWCNDDKELMVAPNALASLEGEVASYPCPAMIQLLPQPSGYPRYVASLGSFLVTPQVP